MTEERDVLSAEEVRRAQMGVSQDDPRWKPVDRLADSHEALRACLEETRRERDDFRSRFELRLEVEALARAVAAEAAAAAAIDALRRLIVLKDGPRDEDYRLEKHRAWAAARAAVDAYETAVLGHATPAAEETCERCNGSGVAVGERHGETRVGDVEDPCRACNGTGASPAAADEERPA